MIKNELLHEYVAPVSKVVALNVKRRILAASNEGVGGKEDDDNEWGA